MDAEKIVIDLKNGRSAILILTPFDTDVDMDELTQIQYHNIMGEILTSSTLLNRVGNLKSEMEGIIAEAKLDFDIWRSNKEKEAKITLTEKVTDEKGKEKINRPTIPEVDGWVVALPEYRTKQLQLLQLQRDFNVINNFYWAVKSKDDKLVKLSEKLRPEEFEKDLVEERVNSVMIRMVKNAIR